MPTQQTIDSFIYCRLICNKPYVQCCSGVERRSQSAASSLQPIPGAVLANIWLFHSDIIWTLLSHLSRENLSIQAIYHSSWLFAEHHVVVEAADVQRFYTYRNAAQDECDHGFDVMTVYCAYLLAEALLFAPQLAQVALAQLTSTQRVRQAIAHAHVVVHLGGQCDWGSLADTWADM